MPVHIALALGSCLLLVSITVIYFRLGSELAPRHRIATSAHAALVAAVLPYGLLVDAATRGHASVALQLPIFLLLLLAILSMAWSVRAFRDRLLLHVAHLLTIALSIPLTFLGSVAIVGWT